MKVVFSSSTLCPPCREEGGCYRGGQTLAGKTQGLENKRVAWLDVPSSGNSSQRLNRKPDEMHQIII